MRTFVFLCLVAFSSGSVLASYELALVLDRNNGSDPALNTAIMRFDPETGTFLGEFGRGIVNGNCTSMLLDQTNNIVHVFDAAGFVMQFNYNSGAYLGEWVPGIPTQGSLGAGYNGGFLSSWAGGNRYVIRHSAAGVYEGYYEAPGGTIWSYTHTTSGFTYGYDNVGKNLFKWNSSALYSLPLSTSNLAASIPNLVGGYKMVAQGNRLLLTGKGSGANIGYGYVIWLDAVGNPSIVTQVTLPASNWSTGVATGHGDLAYFTGYNTVDPARVTRVNTFTGRVRGTFGEAYLTKPQDIVVVTAPEPASLVALGLGALALLRKRRA